MEDNLIQKLTGYQPDDSAIELIKSTKILLLVGPTGAGKDALKVELLKTIPSRRRESIQVPGWPAGWTRFPGCFEQCTVGESDQNRIERARLQMDFCRQVIAVAPLRRIGGQRLEDPDHLGRRTA